MSVKELIKLLKQCPQDLDVMCDNKLITKIEVSKTGDSGYEVGGEIRFIND